MKHVGFTGTQRGMTHKQKRAFGELCYSAIDVDVYHHGDCVGSDEDAHNIMLWDTAASIIIHPPRDESKRAFCKGAMAIRPAKEYLDRNQDIVDEVDVLIATPGEYKEQLRSGTWATIRRARKKGIPIHIILPNGTVENESPA